MRSHLTSRRLIVSFAAAAVAVSSLVATAGSAHSATTGAQSSALHLVGSDEFSWPAGTRPNATLWAYNTGGHGWGNNELQQYTSRTSNVSHDGAGHLRIIARKETYRGSDGITRQYTSAKLTTRVAVQYGRIEARIKVPTGKGLWPAFWTVGQDIYQKGWPYSGEIDILESVNDMSFVSGNLHGKNGNGRWQMGGSVKPVGGIGDAWHTYAIDWRPGSITWYLDGVAYKTVKKSEIPSGADWPFQKPHVLQLNLAVGGDWPGSPDTTTVFPAVMLVDYVRVYAL